MESSMGTLKIERCKTCKSLLVKVPGKGWVCPCCLRKEEK